jgi:hypothetical protein
MNTGVKGKKYKKYSVSIPALYSAWFHAKQRCHNKKYPAYHYYGGRGVKVCLEWRRDYQKFLDWALANGWKKGLQLDKDIKGNGMLYGPDTCVFVTPKENGARKRNCLYFNHKGRQMNMSQIAKMGGISRPMLDQRIKKGMPLKDAISIPNQKNKAA